VHAFGRRATAPLPPGYARVRADGVDGVVWTSLVDGVSAALTHGALYEYARAHSQRPPFMGRGPAYAITIGDTRLVVRHVRHGGMLASLTRDLFIGATRAGHELDVSLRLRDAGIATPEVLGYALYRVAPGVRRADVLTREIPDAVDLLTVLTVNASGTDRASIWDAVRVLVEDLSRTGAVHADLTVQNVLVQRIATGRVIAHVLDVDRVTWHRPGAAPVLRANWGRLNRSARKRGLL
jgi:hypothetical protein